MIIPARFEKDLGRPGGEGAYVGRSPAYCLSVQSGGKVFYTLRAGASVSVVRMEPVGAKSAAPVAEDKLSSTTHLYAGAAGRASHSQTDNWSRVRVPGVYAGVDLAYDSRQSGFELSFSIAPRSAPQRIRLRFQGARRIRIDSAGDLVLETQAGLLRFRHPIAYQRDVVGSRPVPAAFQLRAGVLSFQVGPYDVAKPLIIDPVVSFSSFLGGSGFDAVYAVAVDAAGALYVTGETDSPALPGMTGSGVRPSRDAFVCKFSKDGSTLLYTTILSGNGRDAGQAIAVDSSGSAVVAGVTSGGGFPVTAGALQTGYGGLEDAFVARLGPNGQLVYATYLGGPATDVATGVALDQVGNAYVSGYTASLHFPTTTGAPQKNYGGGTYDAFMSKLNASGGLVYSTLLGGSGSDTASSIAVAPDGGACIAGHTDSNNLLLVNPVQGRVGGSGNAFVGCLNSAGSAWRQLTYFGGVCCMSADGATSIAVDSSGAVYIAGGASSIDFPTTGQAFQRTNRGASDAFVAKLGLSGSLLYSTLIGGSGSDTASSIAVDPSGRVWVAGYTNSLDFPTAGSWVTAAGGGAFDGFVCQLSADGSTLLNSGYLGGSAHDRALGIVLAGPNSAVVAGMTQSTDFPTTAGVLQPSAPASYNGFLLQVSFASATATPGDFNGDGHPDLVWQNDTTRQVTVNYFGGDQGNVLQGWNWLSSSPNPGWTVVGIADFDGDGKPDLVWQNDTTRQVTVNYFGGAQGNVLQGWNWLFSSPNPGWSVVGIADFNGDGKPDLVWQNDSTRQVTVNYFGGPQGNVLQGWKWLYSGPNPGWSVVGIADFNGDGKPDLVWQNDTARQVVVNYFGGAQGNILQGWNWLNSGGSPGWRVAGAIDLNGDRKPDLIWQNDTTRQVTVNYFGGSQGVSLLGWNWVYPYSTSGWRLVW